MEAEELRPIRFGLCRFVNECSTNIVARAEDLNYAAKSVGVGSYQRKIDDASRRGAKTALGWRLEGDSARSTFKIITFYD